MGKKYYCYCDSNCKYETMTKEQILSAIAQATGGSVEVDADAPFVSKIKEMNAGQALSFWVGTQAQYNALASRETNCLYIITDESTKSEMDKLLREIETYYAATQTAAAAAAEAQEAAAKNANKIQKLEAAITTLTVFEQTLSNNGKAEFTIADGEINMVLVTARVPEKNYIMSGVWTPATSGLTDRMYGDLTGNVDRWDTKVTIDGKSVEIARGGTGVVTYYVTIFSTGTSGSGSAVTPPLIN